MFEGLQRRWGVHGKAFFIIFCTFAVTGTFTAWVSRRITDWFSVSKYSVEWWMLKIFVLLVGYQVFILFFGFLFGQFQFFWRYEKKILQHLRILPRPYKIVILASGAGSNANAIIQYIRSDAYKGRPIEVTRIFSSKPQAGVLKIAAENKIPTTVLDKEKFFSGDHYLGEMKGSDLIILAGFLWKIPEAVVKAFPRKIINIHPALLPKYGGKGMYGSNVHEAVILNREKESGITIHYVDEHYDNGDIILQVKCEVKNDTPETLAQKIHQLEHLHYPATIASLLKAKS